MRLINLLDRLIQAGWTENYVNTMRWEFTKQNRYKKYTITVYWFTRHTTLKKEVLSY